MSRLLSRVWPWGIALAVALGAPTATALPGFYVGKGSAKRINQSTHVVIMRKGAQSVVSVMPDYEGPLTPFAFVMPVPSDVTMDRVKTSKREYVDRVENMTAPRFHEFWEMDPCEPGKAEQIWERSTKVSEGTNFLGGGAIPTGGKKVAKELFIAIDPEFKEGEYSFTLLAGEEASGAAAWLKGKGYELSDASAQALAKYVKAGQSVLVAEVDPKRVELVGDDSATLSPIRYATDQPVTKIPDTLGLVNSEGKQETFIYVLHPDKRFEAKNYDNVIPPTNLKVDFVAKERMGELYAAVHDKLLEKNPKGVLVEYAWPSEGCGEPCQNEPLLPNELMSLGGDFLEQNVPEEERLPEPPPLTEEEEKQHEAKLEELKTKPKEKKEYEETFEADRKEVARRKALIARQKYVVSRLHHRYDASNLPADLELQSGPAVTGGAGLPKGEQAELSTKVEQTQQNKLQIRYNFFHPWAGMMKCEDPQRFRWGKPPRTYRGLRKIWVATDLTRKNRKQLDPAAVIQTPVPELGLTGAPTDAGADGGTDGEKTKSKCGCHAPGAPAGPGATLTLLAAFALSVLRRRR